MAAQCLLIQIEIDYDNGEEALFAGKQTFKRVIFNSIRGTTSLLILISVKSVLPDLVYSAQIGTKTCRAESREGSISGLIVQEDLNRKCSCIPLFDLDNPHKDLKRWKFSRIIVCCGVCV